MSFKVTLFAIGIGAFIVSGNAAEDPTRYEKDIAAFEKKDAATPTTTNLILFVGSSSIRSWKTLAEDMVGYETINRGFGGSQISDVLHFFDRLFAAHRPAQLVFYCGENDIHKGKDPERVVTDFSTFLTKMRAHTPDVHIHFIAMKPSPKRWALWPTYQQGNARIQAMSAADPKLSFLDVGAAMIGEDGKPLPEIWVDDKLHLNHDGYRIWTRLVRDALSGQDSK